MALIIANNAESTLAASLGGLNTDRTLVIQTADATKFPAINPGGVGADSGQMTLEDATGNREIVSIARHDSGSSTFTVDRGQEGTSIRAWALGDIAAMRLTAGMINTTFAHPAQSTGAHQASAIAFSPTGNIAASTVQAAIAELDSEKAGATGSGATGTWSINISGNAAAATTAAKSSVSEGANAGITTGTNTAYVLAPTAAITAYAANLSFWVTFHLASGASPTLQISGLASPPSLVRYNSAGALVNIAAGELPSGFATRVTLLSSTQALIEEMPPASGTQQPGEICYFAFNTAPTGFLKANGAAVSRTTYAALFTVLGTNFGVGNGSTTFNLPDLRGEFLRGWDDGRGVDTGRLFGSAQSDAFQGHWHDLWGLASQGSNVGTADDVTNPTASLAKNAVRAPVTDGTNGTPRTASETRPRNIALLACIKF